MTAEYGVWEVALKVVTAPIRTGVIGSAAAPARSPHPASAAAKNGRRTKAARAFISAPSKRSLEAGLRRPVGQQGLLILVVRIRQRCLLRQRVLEEGRLDLVLRGHDAQLLPLRVLRHARDGQQGARFLEP